jgi:capsular exopolysaccharide synthesis family protein
MEINVQQYLRLLARWWWLIIIGAIIPVVVSYYFVSQQPIIYQTKVVLMVGTTLQSANPDMGKMSLAGQLARGYAKMVRYRPMTNAVIEKLGLERSPDALANQITAYVLPEANLLEIRVIDTNPQVAAMIANALADELIQQSPGSQTHSEQQQFVERQLTKLKAEIEQIEKEIEVQKAELVKLTSAIDIRAAEDNLSSLETILSRYRAEYTLYLQSYAGSSVNQITIVEPAVDGFPMGGKKVMLLGIAAVAGIGLAVAGIFLIEFMDDTVQWSGNQEEKLFNYAVLGAIGRMSTDPKAMTARTKERSPEAEALRALRTTVLLRRLRHPYQTLLLTSANSGEGKSTVTANLSTCIAADGLRVIVVDADMRKPTLHEHFDRPNISGLSDLLKYTTPPEDIDSLKGLQTTDTPGLWLLSAGPLPLDPTILLMSPNFPRLVQSLSQRADIVIFDSPPVLAVPDVEILITEIDSIVLVAADRVTAQSRLTKAAKRFDEYTQVDLLGILFNEVKLRERTNRYYYYRSKSSHLTQFGSIWQRLLPQTAFTQVDKDDPDRLLPLSEAAEQLGINRRTARRWAKTGRLPIVKNGRRRRVRQEDVQRLIARETIGQAELPLPPNGNGRDTLASKSSTSEDLPTPLDVGKL